MTHTLFCWNLLRIFFLCPHSLLVTLFPAWNPSKETSAVFLCCWAYCTSSFCGSPSYQKNVKGASPKSVPSCAFNTAPYPCHAKTLFLFTAKRLQMTVSAFCGFCLPVPSIPAEALVCPDPSIKKTCSWAQLSVSISSLISPINISAPSNCHPHTLPVTSHTPSMLAFITLVCCSHSPVQGSPGSTRL